MSLERTMPGRPGQWTLTLGLAAALAIGACSESGSEQAPKTLPVTSTAGAYLAGRHADQVKDARAASDFFSQALRRDPDSLRVLLRAFHAHIGSGRIAEAVELARKVIQIQPDSVLANLVLISEAAREGKYDEIAPRLEHLSSGSGARLVQPILSAWTVFGQTGDPKQAVGRMATLSVDPQLAIFYRIHGALMYRAAGDAEEAGKRFAELHDSQTLPSLRVVQIVAGHLARNGKKDEARKVIEEFLSTNPDSSAAEQLMARLEEDGDLGTVVKDARGGIAELFLNVAGALQSSGRIDQALFFAQLARHIRADDPATVYMLGSVLEDDKQYEAAVAAYDRVPRDSLFSWTARKSAVASLVALERYDAAIKQLDEMAEERKDRWDALALLGNLHRSRSEFGKAVQAYDKALERIGALQKHHWNLLYVHGIALERSKAWSRAEDSFRKALELRPDEPYVLNYLAYSWVERGENLTRAEEMLQKAVKQRPNDGYIVDSVGWVAYRLGNFEDAVKYLERATELRPQDPTINDHLGDAYWRTGRRNEARVQWRRALSLEPEADDIPAIRRKLEKGMDAFEPVKSKTPGKPDAPAVPDKAAKPGQPEK